MKERRFSKRITAVFLSLFMVAATVFSTDISVNASTFTNTVLQPTVAAVSSAAVRIKWNKVSGAEGYALWKRKSSASNWENRVATLKNGNTTTYTFTGLKLGESYTFAVRAYKTENGKTVMTKYKTVTQTVQMYPVTAKISDASTANSARVKVTWNRVGGATRYRMWKRVVGKGWNAIGNFSSSTSSYVDSNVDANTSYEYCVRGYAVINGKGTYTKVIASNAITTAKSASLTTAQKEIIKKILYAVESGGNVYGKQDYAAFDGVGANSANEVAITIGAGQWYGVEAKRLLQLIQTRYPAKFKALDTAGIASDLKTASWSTYGVTKTSAKGKCIIAIISSAEGKACQDSLMLTQIGEMETVIRKNTSVSNADAVAECINMYHQGGWGSVTRVLKKTKTPYTLDNIYSAMQSDTGNQVGAYRTRQKTVYEALKKYMS